MKKTVALVAFIAMISSPTFANDTENNELSSEDMAQVVSGVITLKSQCVNKFEDVCKQAEAVMKLFKKYTLENSKSDGDLKNNMGLLMGALVDGYIDANADSKKDASSCPPGHRKSGENECERTK
jgi:hypothetical protein